MVQGEDTLGRYPPPTRRSVSCRLTGSSAPRRQSHEAQRAPTNPVPVEGRPPRPSKIPTDLARRSLVVTPEEAGVVRSLLFGSCGR